MRRTCAESGPGLLRAATWLTGGDAHLAEDLVQITLTRLYLAWPRVRRMHVGAYAHRTLVHAYVDEKRRGFVRHERSRARPPDAPTDRHPPADEALLAALAALPTRMRAAVVLRHVEDLSVEQTADALGCSTGTVKSQTARGLDKLRDLLGGDHTYDDDTRGDQPCTTSSTGSPA